MRPKPLIKQGACGLEQGQFQDENTRFTDIARPGVGQIDAVTRKQLYGHQGLRLAKAMGIQGRSAEVRRLEK